MFPPYPCSERTAAQRYLDYQCDAEACVQQKIHDRLGLPPSNTPRRLRPTDPQPHPDPCSEATDAG